MTLLSFELYLVGWEKWGGVGAGGGGWGGGGDVHQDYIYNLYFTTYQFVRTCGCMLACLSERAVSIPAT